MDRGKDTADFEYRISIPPKALQIRGKSCDIVENILSKKDKEEAKKWYELAAKNGDEEAKQELEERF